MEIWSHIKPFPCTLSPGKTDPVSIILEIGFIDFNNLGIFRFQKVLICSIARIQNYNYNRGNSILGRFLGVERSSISLCRRSEQAQ